MYTSLPSEVNNLPRFRTQNMPRNASTTGFFSPPNINNKLLLSLIYIYMQIFTPKGTHLAISCTKKGKIKIIRWLRQ